MDRQSVKTVEEPAHIYGYDIHKCVKGRERHLLVDMLGLPITSYVTSADVHDADVHEIVGTRKLLAELAPLAPRLKKIWADAACRGKELAEWCKEEGGCELEVVERAPDTWGFSLLPRRWLVERCFA
jgi:putative transposase